MKGVAVSGLIRNVFTILHALFIYGFGRKRTSVADGVCSHFWIGPWDTGIKTLKSDKYFQLAESAQIDFVIRAGLLGPMLASGTAFVNVSQLVSFMKPVYLFQRVQVLTHIIYADEKYTYFSHQFYIRESLHAELLVKMKFKRKRLTVEPFSLLQMRFDELPAQLIAWNQTLQAMAPAGRAPE
ncbi:thioesterase family protein [Undibacterium pigrum]|uniref:thioesterase family protein n=1 Tax=Undibacterium pigrum TaxID=401470 RepID=UPI000D774206|nr:thioesterase family protein [Undibacterium pigrum]